MPETMREVLHLAEQVFSAFVERQETIVEHLGNEIQERGALIDALWDYIEHGSDDPVVREALHEWVLKILGKDK